MRNVKLDYFGAGQDIHMTLFFDNSRGGATPGKYAMTTLIGDRVY